MPTELEIHEVESFLRNKYFKDSDINPVNVRLFVWRNGLVQDVPIKKILEVAEKMRDENKRIWLAIDTNCDFNVLGAFASLDKAKKFVDERQGAKTKWRKQNNGTYISEDDCYGLEECILDNN